MELIWLHVLKYLTVNPKLTKPVESYLVLGDSRDPEVGLYTEPSEVLVKQA